MPLVTTLFVIHIQSLIISLKNKIVHYHNKFSRLFPLTTTSWGNATSRFKFHSVNQDFIGKLIDNLKNKASYGHENISNKLIKCAKKVFIEPLILLVNQMLESCYFLLKLKLSTSKVKPPFRNDMFQSSLWKLYCKLIKSQLPPYFDTLLLAFTNFCDNYSLRLSTFCLPLIKHAFAEQRLDYQLIKICNADGLQDVILRAQALFL